MFDLIPRGGLILDGAGGVRALACSGGRPAMSALE
jgi:hypothetical protein